VIHIIDSDIGSSRWLFVYSIMHDSKPYSMISSPGPG